MNLWEHLSESWQRERLQVDLVERLNRVRQSAERIWRSQRFDWFPDHTVAHSNRIIGHLGDVVCHLQVTSKRLNPHQLYILLSACYLHDIGMQDFRVAGRTVDQLTIDDYELIRSRHSERSMELIVQGTIKLEREDFRIDLEDDPQYTMPIALVSRGHASFYFDDTVEELRVEPYRPGNQELRGDLLTALLLMGDELDLHEVRARFPPGIELSHVAAIHNHVHHYVTGVEVVDGKMPRERRVRITFQYPSNSETYQGDVRWWVVSKLRRQMRRTAPVIARTTAGELTLDEEIHVRESVDRYGVRRQLPERARLLLRRERLEATTVGRQELITKVTQALFASEPRYEFIEVVDQDNSDWGHLLKWLATMIEWCNAKLVHVSLEISIGHGPQDLLERCCEQLVSQGLSCSTYEAAKQVSQMRGWDTLKPLYEALVADLENQARDSRIVLLFERVEQAEPQTSDWLRQSLLRDLAERSIPVIAIVTHRDSMETLGLGPCFRLETFSREALATHLIERLGYSQEEAEDRAEGMHALSRGTPLNVLDYLYLAEEQQTKLERVRSNA